MPAAFDPETYEARANVAKKAIQLLQDIFMHGEDFWARQHLIGKLQKEVTYWEWRYKEAVDKVEGRPPPRWLGASKIRSDDV